MTTREALEALARRAHMEGIDLPRDVLDELERFVAALHEWSARVNLVSRRELDQVVEKHVAPSLAPLLAAPAPATEHDVLALDIGSGGGFPGLVLALCRPAWRVHLVEPRRRKALFLEKMARRARNVRVWRCRAEALAGEAELAARADLVTARAVARPAEVWRLARPVLAAHGEAHVYVPGDAHDALARELVETHDDVEVLAPIAPGWWKGCVLRARRPLTPAARAAPGDPDR